MVGACVCFGINRISIAEKQMEVLVVDDIPLNRDIAVALLAKENCKCDTAVDGVEAVASSKQKAYPSKSRSSFFMCEYLIYFDWCSYDLILLDIQMPRMTGTEAIYCIYSFFPLLPTNIAFDNAKVFESTKKQRDCAELQ